MPDYAAALASLYDAFADPITVDGDATKRGILDGGFIDAGGLAVVGVDRSLRVIASEVPLLEKDSVVIVAGVTYRARRLEPMPPDELETRVSLERQ